MCLVSACSGGDLTLPGSNGAAALEIVSGDEQRARAGARLNDPLLVRVVDASARPVRGATVEFRFLDSPPGATLDPAVAETDQDGYAAALARLGSEAGDQRIVASIAGSPDLRATFRAVAFGGGDHGDQGGGSDGTDDGDDDD